MSFTLDAALDQAVAFLTLSLARFCAPLVLVQLQLELRENLKEFYEPSWISHQPTSGSGRRALTLAQGVPPRPIYNTCQATRINWNGWMMALSKQVGLPEFDLFVDPGCVSVRYGRGQSVSVWVAEPKPRAAPIKPRKTLAQRVSEVDALEFDELSAMIDHFSPIDEVPTPNWLRTTIDAFPGVPAIPSRRSVSPSDSLRSSHSRSSSFSSISSASGASFSSVETDSSASSSLRRDRRSPVFIDATKKEVTPYDGGKTTVLTGGVMLGAKPAAAPRKTSPARLPLPEFWRGSRF